MTSNSREQLYLVHNSDLFRTLLRFIAEFMLFQFCADLRTALYVRANGTSVLSEEEQEQMEKKGRIE